MDTEKSVSATVGITLAFTALALLYTASAKADFPAGTTLTIETGRVRNGIAPPGVWYQPGFDYKANLESQSARAAITWKGKDWYRWQAGFDWNHQYSGNLRFVSDENYNPSLSPPCNVPCETPRIAHYTGTTHNFNLSVLPTYSAGRFSAFGRVGVAIFRSTMTVKTGNCVSGYDCSIIFPATYRMNKTGFSPYLGAGMEYRGWVAEVIAAPGISATLDSIQRGTVAYYVGYAWKI